MYKWKPHCSKKNHISTVRKISKYNSADRMVSSNLRQGGSWKTLVSAQVPWFVPAPFYCQVPDSWLKVHFTRSLMYTILVSQLHLTINCGLFDGHHAAPYSTYWFSPSYHKFCTVPTSFRMLFCTQTNQVGLSRQYRRVTVCLNCSIKHLQIPWFAG